MNIFPISFIKDESELVTKNIKYFLEKADFSSKKCDDENFWTTLLDIIKLQLYFKENSLKNYLLTEPMVNMVTEIRKNFIKNINNNLFPEYLIKELHQLDLNFIFVGLEYKEDIKLKNIIDFNIFNYYLKNLNEKKHHEIDAKMMAQMYYYYINSGGIGYKVGSKANKDKINLLLEYFKTNKPDEFNDFLSLKYYPLRKVDLSTKNSLPYYKVVNGLFEDFVGTIYTNKILDSLFNENLSPSSVSVCFNKNEEFLHKVFHYIVNHYTDLKVFNSNHLSVTCNMFVSYLDYIPNSLYNKVEETLKNIIDVLIKNPIENKKVAIPFILLERAGLQSYQKFNELTSSYSNMSWMENDCHYYVNSGSKFIKSPATVFIVEGLNVCKFDYFNIIQLFNNFKNNVNFAESKFDNQEDYQSPSDLVKQFKNSSKITLLTEHKSLSLEYSILDFLDKDNPDIKDFENLFCAISIYKTLREKYNNQIESFCVELNNKRYNRVGKNNLFTFISEYIRNEPIHIIEYFNDAMKSVFDESSKYSDNEFVQYLTEVKKVLPETYMDNAHNSSIELDEFLLNKVIPVSDVKIKKIKF